MVPLVSAAAFIANDLWNCILSWRLAEPKAGRDIQVSSPVSDSVIALVDCNCHCQDNAWTIAAFYIAGIFTVLFVVLCCRAYWPRVCYEEPKEFQLFRAVGRSLLSSRLHAAPPLLPVPVVSQDGW